MEMNTTHIIKIPKMFWDDHLQRDCVDHPYEVRELTKHFVITLTELDLMDLLDDAHHHATEPDLDWDMMPLKSSARATRDAIFKQIGKDQLAAMWIKHDAWKPAARFLGLPIDQYTTN